MSILQLAVALLTITTVGLSVLVVLLLARLRAHRDRERSQNVERARLEHLVDAYGVAIRHDLRAPFANITMAVYTLDRDNIGGQGALLDIIERSAERALGMMDDLAALSKSNPTPPGEPVETAHADVEP